MRNEEQIRKLARSSYYQTIYRTSKECGGIKLFLNENNFSSLQVDFMHWISIYYMLYEELAKHEDIYLTENVIQNDERCNAYLVYRNKKQEHLWKKYRQEERLNELKSRHPNKMKDGKIQICDVDLRGGK